MIRWLHLSDFHVGKDDYAGRKLFEYIHSHVSERVAAGFVPDVVFVSGDLANHGRDEEHSEFWLEFAAPLLERADLDDDRLFVVPGNHDVERDENPAFARSEMVEPASRYFDPSAEGLKLRGLLLPRFASYLAADQTAGGTDLRDLQGSYATVMALNDAQVGIAGINTAWLSKDDHDKEKLTAGKPLLEHALTELERGGAEVTFVLGHHPISWFVEAEQKPIKALLAKHSAFYLHGHLHSAWTEPTYGGASQFLAIQSGAAFQAREGEKWQNGLVWGQLDLDEQVVRLQARKWNAAGQDWSLIGDAYPEDLRDGDWWVYPTPGSENARSRATRLARSRPKVPSGWESMQGVDLARYAAPLDETEAIGYFDGAIPTWKVALSTSVPRRAVVESLIADITRAAANPGQPTVTLLLAAAGEGKSTALLQTAAGVASDGNWRIVRRLDDSAKVPPDLLDGALADDARWLVVIDDAERAANDLCALLTRLPGDLRPRVHAIVASRDSDWRGASASDLPWATFSHFTQTRMDGLDQLDATAIVEAWAAFGKAGLGDLDGVDEATRVDTLVDTARDTSATGAVDALFGALLTVRHGSDLQNHARLLMERLGAKTVTGTTTLRDAFAFVAAMHSEGLAFLSRVVLAKALSIPTNELHGRVIFPLGREAAATSTSTYVFTRHQKIAQTAVELLEAEYGVDIGDDFSRLAAAAVDARQSGEYVPDLGEWRFALSNHFMETDRPEIAIEIARTIVDHAPADMKSRVQLAHLYRLAGDPTLGAELLRGPVSGESGLRAYYLEWGLCEAASGDKPLGTALLAHSLGDQISRDAPEVMQAQFALNALGLDFQIAYRTTGDATYRDAQIAVAVIGKRLPEAPRSYHDQLLNQGLAEGGNLCTPDEALGLLAAGVRQAVAGVTSELVSAHIPATETLTFEGVRQKIRDADRTRSTNGRQ